MGQSADGERLAAYLSRAEDVLKQAVKILGVSNVREEEFNRLSLDYLSLKMQQIEEKTTKSIADCRHDIRDAIHHSNPGLVGELRNDMVNLIARVDALEHRVDNAGAYVRDLRKVIDEMRQEATETT